MLNEQYYFDQYEEREAEMLERIQDLKEKIVALRRENELLRQQIMELGEA